MKLISVIVPIYNAEAYLDRCIQSIISQTYANFELILVNDGSTDKSLEICNNYASRDSRIIVISQKKSGVSSARNQGIEIAKGEWITFIDADDFVDNNYIDALKLHINSENSLMLIIQGYKKLSGGNIDSTIEFPDITIQGIEFGLAFKEYGIMEHGQPWGKLYNRSLLQEKKIRFNRDISYSEDLLFMLEYILHCDFIKFVQGSLYNYVIDASTLSQRYNSFESEFLLFTEYTRLNKAIANKFTFAPTDKSQRCGALMLMRSIYSMFINKDKSRKERYDIIRNIRKEKYTYIKKYYKPQITLFKAIKLALMINPLLFDIICKLKFR